MNEDKYEDYMKGHIDELEESYCEAHQEDFDDFCWASFEAWSQDIPDEEDDIPDNIEESEEE